MNVGIFALAVSEILSFDFLTYFSGERPFICELCGNSYTDIKNLKKHKTKVHSGKCLCFLKIWSSHLLFLKMLRYTF